MQLSDPSLLFASQPDSTRTLLAISVAEDQTLGRESVKVGCDHEALVVRLRNGWAEGMSLCEERVRRREDRHGGSTIPGRRN